MSVTDHQEVVEQDTDKVKCPSCGGPMAFNPTTQGLTCEYCGHTKELALEGELTNYDFYSQEQAANHQWGDGLVSFHCESCGASSTVDEKNTTSTCPFCGSHHILKTNDEKGISPHAVVPFLLTREDAFELFEKWIKRRFFAKKAIKDSRDSERLKGVYIPYWQFDVDTETYYSCQIGYNYTVTVQRTVVENGKSVTKNVTETRIRWVHKSGHIRKLFDDYLINASKTFNSAKINALEPFDMTQAKPYDKGLISGFVAQKYDLSLQDGFEHLKPRLHDELVYSIKRKHNGDHIRSARLNTDYLSVEFQHTLLPVWLSSYMFGGKTYQFGINGQTGEVQGTYPIDWVRVALVVFAILMLVGAYFLYQYMTGGYEVAILLETFAALTRETTSIL